MPAPERVRQLIETFEQNIAAYHSQKNETELRRQFLDPFFEALGWDVDNKKGYDERSKEVAHEYSVEIDGAQKKADYAFRVARDSFDFLVEAKKPSVKIESNLDAAFQIRRYGWSAGLPINILTDFEHFAIYDCRARPNYSKDKVGTGLLKIIHYKEYIERWDEIAGLFSPDAIRKGALDQYRDQLKGKKGTQEVDAAFLEEIEAWRETLAKNIALRNKPKNLTEDQINFAVQMTIDRIIFLRIAEERGMEKDRRLFELTTPPALSGTLPKSDEPQSDLGRAGEGSVYHNLLNLFQQADARYNSGLFHFKKEKDRENPDTLTPELEIDDKVLKDILKDLYYPSPYAFNYIPADILGSVYERFLGKVIRLTADRNAKVDEKPEVRKAGGVYYTPTYIVDYIVKNTVGKLLSPEEEQHTAKSAKDAKVLINLGGLGEPRGSKELTPDEVSHIKIVDPACGSGSFLLGAYQFLLDWHLDWYASNNPEKNLKAKKILTADNKTYRLSLDEKKRVLLNNIHGVDIDPQAVEVTKLSLLLKVVEDPGQLKMFEEGHILPNLNKNIKNGNALIGMDYFSGQMFGDMEEMKRVKPFEWKDEFPEVFKRGGFDVVIGNPPYIDSEWLTKTNPKLREYCVTHYESAKGNWDIFCVFVEKCLKLSRQYSSMIVPNKLLSADYARYTRNFITSKHLLIKIRDFSNVPVFPVAVYPIVYVAKTTKLNNDESIVYELMRQIERDKVEVETKIALSHEKLDNLEGESWSVLFSGEKGNIVEKIRNNSSSLEKIASVGGAATVSEAYEYKEILQNEPTEEEYLIFVNTGTVDRYSILWGLKPTTYIKGKYDKPAISKSRWKKLSANRLSQSRQPKVIVGGMNKHLECVYDDGKIMAGKSTSIIHSSKVNLLYLLGILNSKLITHYYRTVFSGLSLQGGFFRIGPPQLKELPIKVVESTEQQHTKMVSLVEQMLALHKQVGRDASRISSNEKELLERQIKSTDRQIDELVYQLYDLTPEEIKIVEGD